MSGVIKNPVMLALANSWHHIRGHWSKPCPRCYFSNIDVEATTGPVNEGAYSIASYIGVIAIKFSGTCHTQTIVAQATRHNLSFFVKQTNIGSIILAFFVIKMHGNRGAFYGVNINTIPKRFSNFFTTHTRTKHKSIKIFGVPFRRYPRGCVGLMPIDSNTLL